MQIPARGDEESKRQRGGEKTDDTTVVRECAANVIGPRAIPKIRTIRGLPLLTPSSTPSSMTQPRDLHKYHIYAPLAGDPPDTDVPLGLALAWLVIRATPLPEHAGSNVYSVPFVAAILDVVAREAHEVGFCSCLLALQLTPLRSTPSVERMLC